MKKLLTMIGAAAVAVLCVVTPSTSLAGTAQWNGNAGNGSLSDGDNWDGGEAPATGDALDFSAITTATTLNADFGDGRTFGVVTMGSAVITFSGSLTAASFSAYPKVAVGTDSTVTITGNLSFTYSNKILCDSIAAGGKLVLNGLLTIAHSSGDFMFAQNSSDGAVVAAGGIVVNTGKWIVMNAKSLVLGTDGISFSQSAPFHFTNSGTVYSLGATTVLGTEGIGSYCASNDKPLTICTTQFESDQPATITLAGNFTGKNKYYAEGMVTGCGKVVFASTSTSNRGLTVNDGTTLAMTPGANTSAASDQTFAVKSGAALEVASAGTVGIGGKLTFEAGSTLNIADYSAGAAALSVAKTLTLPSSGTVNLTFNGGAFTPGVYVICQNSGVTAAMGDKFSFSTGGETFSWRVLNNRLILTVGTIPANRWTGAFGDGSMANGENWAGGVAPVADGVADFSGVTAATTVNADLGVKLSTVTMGSGVTTFTNSLTATAFSDYSKLAVGADSTVTIDNSLTFSGNANTRLCYTVEESGELRVTGSLSIATSKDFHFAAKANFDAAAGAIVVEGGITINTSNYTVLNAGKLVLGANGMSILLGRLCIWSNASFYSLGAETILRSGRYEIYNDHLLTFCTTQYGIELPATITFEGSLLQRGNHYGSAMVAGCGMAVFPSSATANRNVSVDDGATLAVSTGAVFSVTTSDTTSTVNSGGTIEVSESGVFTVSSKFTLADGACLGFNFTDKAVAPSLAVASGKTVTIGSTVNVKISASDDIRPKGGTYTLTGGMDFTGKTVNIVDRPDWVQSVEIDASGNLVAMVKHNGLIIIYY